MATQPYKINGVRVPSVTTILSRFKESGGLLYWANQQGLEGKTLDDARQEVATPGTIAHEMIQAHIAKRSWTNTKGYDGELVATAERSLAACKTWMLQSKLVFIYTEVSLLSERHRFGGTLDAIGTLGGDPAFCLADWKASNAVYADYLYQMAAYKILWEESYPQHLITAGFHLCRFAKEHGDFSHHYYPNLDAEAETFLKMRELYDRVKATEKRVR